MILLVSRIDILPPHGLPPRLTLSLLLTSIQLHSRGARSLIASPVSSHLDLNLGSSISWRLSPRRLVAMTTVNMARPGNVEIHHARPSTSRPTATISPHSGVGRLRAQPEEAQAGADGDGVAELERRQHQQRNRSVR